MRIDVACSYCFGTVRLDVGAVTITRRSVDVCTFTCPHCRSKTIVEVSTRRKSKGAKQKAAEARTLAAHDVEIEAARAENARIGAQLIAEDGCTCVLRFDSRSGMRHGDRDTGHPLSTGWSRAASGAMLPTKPDHFPGCPLWRRGAR